MALRTDWPGHGVSDIFSFRSFLCVFLLCVFCCVCFVVCVLLCVFLLCVCFGCCVSPGGGGSIRLFCPYRGSNPQKSNTLLTRRSSLTSMDRFFRDPLPSRLPLPSPSSLFHRFGCVYRFVYRHVCRSVFLFRVPLRLLLRLPYFLP